MLQAKVAPVPVGVSSRAGSACVLALGLLALPGCASMEEAARRAEDRRLADYMQGGPPVFLIGMQNASDRRPLLATLLRRFGGAEQGWPPPGRDTPQGAGFEEAGRRWVVMRADPGRYVLSLGMVHVLTDRRFPEFEAPLGWTNLMVEMPPGVGVAYVGTLQLACAPGSRRFANDTECRLEPMLLQEPELAAAAHGRLGEAGRLAPAPALPGLPAPAAMRLRPPVAVAEVATDPARWRTGVEWREFTGDERSRQTLRAAGTMLDAAAQIGGSSELGAVVSLPILAAAAATGVAGAAVAGAESIEQSRAEREWGECAARLRGALAPEALAAEARTALAARSPANAAAQAPSPRGRRAAAGEPASQAVTWRLTLSRIALRRCDGAQGYGIDVATRWTAWPPGAAEPAYDASVLSRVAQPVEDSRLQALRPWSGEMVLPETLPCRPFATYCAPGGEALLARDVADAVVAARDAVASGR